MLSRTVRFLGALCVAILLPASAVAQRPATRFLEQRHAAVNRAIRRLEGDRRQAEVARLIGELLNYQELSRQALAAQWGTLTTAQRTEFATLLQQLVERSYQRNLESTLNYEVNYVLEEPTEGGTLVRTLARSRTNRRAPPVEINYTLAAVGDRYQVLDITTDGVSMVRNYRRQFTRIIQRDGWNGLIDRMRRRLSEGTTGSDAAETN